MEKALALGVPVTPADLVAAVNALPTNTARLDCAQHLRAFYGWPDVDAHDLPYALAAVASFDTPQGATAAGTGQTGDGPSRPVPVSEAHTERLIRDDSPEVRADRLQAGAATVRLTADLGGILVDQHGREYWQPLDQGPRVPAGVELWFFDPGAEAKMGAKDREAWNQALLLSARMMQLRSEWENERAGRAVPLLVAADDSTPF
jgi:hypothetical protein